MPSRWFSGSASGALGVHPSHFTVRENTTLRTLKHFANQGMPGSPTRDRELLHCLDAQGTVVHDVSFGRSKVADITGVMRDAMHAGYGVRLWHNHPSEDSLSGRDWYAAAAHPCTEILVATLTGTIFVGRMPIYKDAFLRVIGVHDTLACEVEREIERHAKSNGTS